MPLGQIIQQENSMISRYPSGVVPLYPVVPEKLSPEDVVRLRSALTRRFYASFETAPLSGNQFIREWAKLEAAREALAALGK